MSEKITNEFLQKHFGDNMPIDAVNVMYYEGDVHPINMSGDAYLKFLKKFIVSRGTAWRNEQKLKQEQEDTIDYLQRVIAQVQEDFCIDDKYFDDLIIDHVSTE